MWLACKSCQQKAREDKIAREILFKSNVGFPLCFTCWVDRNPTPVRTTKFKVRYDKELLPWKPYQPDDPGRKARKRK